MTTLTEVAQTCVSDLRGQREFSYLEEISRSLGSLVHGQSSIMFPHLSLDLQSQLQK